MLNSKPSLEALNTAPPHTQGHARSRSKSIPQDDLTSPRIASLGLGFTSGGSPDRAAAGIDGKELPHGAPKFDEALEDAEEIDDGFTACE